jgi:hypothetical protein
MKFLKYILPVVLFTTVHAAPISIELTGGSVINGDLISWDGNEVQIKAEFGTLKFKKDTLSTKTLERLDLQSGDPQKVAAKIAELEATVASLRRDNAALRQQLAQATAQGAPTTVAPTSGVTSRSSAPATENSGLSYSKSSTGKRHNSNCRYFGSGSPCGPTDGVACKTCGG